MSTASYDEGVFHMLDMYRGELKRLNSKGTPDSNPRIGFLKTKINELNREVRIFKMKRG